MSSLNTNGRARKSLADQIDRLDAILDGLAEALNEAVSAAVKSAVGVAVEEAVRGLVSEVLANPQTLTRLRDMLRASDTAHARLAEPERVPLREQIVAASHTVRAHAQAAGRASGAFLRRLPGTLVACGRRSGEALRRLWRSSCQWLFRRRWLVLAGVVGLVVAMSAYHAGPWLAALASGVGGFLATQAARTNAAVGRMLRPVWDRLVQPRITLES